MVFEVFSLSSTPVIIVKVVCDYVGLHRNSTGSKHRKRTHSGRCGDRVAKYWCIGKVCRPFIDVFRLTVKVEYQITSFGCCACVEESRVSKGDCGVSGHGHV